MYTGRGRLCVCMSICLFIPRRIPTLLHGPGCNLVKWYRGCPLVVHYWVDLQSVHGIRCYDNIAPNAKCQRVLVLALGLVNCCNIVVIVIGYSQKRFDWIQRMPYRISRDKTKRRG